jgi:hypothetical protein
MASQLKTAKLASRSFRKNRQGNPANIPFNKKTRSLLVTNYAGLTGLPDPSFLFAIFVNDKAGKWRSCG